MNAFHMTKQKTFAMYQDAVRKPIGDWTEKRLAKLTGKSVGRHNSERGSGFGRDLRNWVDKDTALPGNTVSVHAGRQEYGAPGGFSSGAS